MSTDPAWFRAVFKVTVAFFISCVLISAIILQNTMLCDLEDYTIMIPDINTPLALLSPQTIYETKSPCDITSICIFVTLERSCLDKNKTDDSILSKHTVD